MTTAKDAALKANAKRAKRIEILADVPLQEIRNEIHAMQYATDDEIKKFTKSKILWRRRSF